MQTTPKYAASEHAILRQVRSMAQVAGRLFAGAVSPMEFAAYATIAGGYLLAVLTAQGQLTVLGLAALTLGNLAWLWIFQRMEANDCTGPRLMRLVVGLIVVTILVEALPLLGVGFDWLLPLVTVGVIGSLYPWRRALALTGVVYGLSAAMIVVLGDKAQEIFNNLVTLTPACIFVFAFSVVARWQDEQRKRAEALVAQLEEAQAQLRTYAHEVEELSATRERNRIAREIHDTLGHYLTILAVQLETATKLEERGDPRLHSELVEARRVASECLNEVRHSVAALRPTDPTATSFGDALARLAAEFEAVHPDAEVVVDVEGAVQALPPEVRVALYRCVQESLTNIRKHAEATKVLVRLRVGVRDAELLVLDNGAGVASSTDGHEPGFGIVGMRERIALLGGRMECGPEAGRGWRVDVWVPLPDGRQSAADAESAAAQGGTDVKEQVVA